MNNEGCLSNPEAVFFFFFFHYWDAAIICKTSMHDSKIRLEYLPWQQSEFLLFFRLKSESLTDASLAAPSFIFWWTGNHWNHFLHRCSPLPLWKNLSWMSILRLSEMLLFIIWSILCWVAHSPKHDWELWPLWKWSDLESHSDDLEAQRPICSALLPSSPKRALVQRVQNSTQSLLMEKRKMLITRPGYESQNTLTSTWKKRKGKEIDVIFPCPTVSCTDLISIKVASKTKNTPSVL